MDFILGIFTGISFAVLYGHFLTERARKREEKQREQLLNHLFGKSTSCYNEWLATVIRDPRTAEEQLKDAINREDFKEAARLRDLMNRK